MLPNNKYTDPCGNNTTDPKGLDAVHVATRRSRGVQSGLLVHNGGTEKTAGYIASRNLNSPRQGLGPHPTHQSFSNPPALPDDTAEDMYLKEIHKAELDALAYHTASMIENGGLQKLADTIMNEEISRMEADFALSRRETQT